MSLLAANDAEAAALESLKKAVKGNPLPIVFGTKAVYARAASVKHIVEGGREMWNVEWLPDESNYGGGGVLSEFNLTNYSTDDVAELRARRILLDERLFGTKSPFRGHMNDLNAGLLDKSIASFNTRLQVPRSPFPALYAAFRKNTAEFLTAARLFAVMQLLLTNTVERIHLLELQMHGVAKLVVKFEGQRRAQYANRPAHIIKVEGVCELEGDADQ